ncbi:hypothetical protein Tco_0702941 [Tanacetum coccineum]|uniref:DUF4219 domain-containing protein n=1 Tax=Tanacetum coccineum TaxID=301880 RepID=A0ABQ4XYG2_9ASTR
MNYRILGNNNTTADSFFKPYLITRRKCDTEKEDKQSQTKRKYSNTSEFIDEQPNKRMCKAEKFEAIQYSLGPNEEYISIRRCEYDIWERNGDNMSKIYQDIFQKKDKRWKMIKYSFNDEEEYVAVKEDEYDDLTITSLAVEMCILAKLMIEYSSRLLGLKRLHGFLKVTAAQVHNGNYAKWFGINKWYQSFALRNFDLEDMELESINSGPTAKLPILKLGEYEMWAIRIKQYFQIQDYALWEVIENGDSMGFPVSQTS